MRLRMESEVCNGGDLLESPPALRWNVGCGTSSTVSKMITIDFFIDEEEFNDSLGWEEEGTKEDALSITCFHSLVRICVDGSDLFPDPSGDIPVANLPLLGVAAMLGEMVRLRPGMGFSWGFDDGDTIAVNSDSRYARISSAVCETELTVSLDELREAARDCRERLRYVFLEREPKLQGIARWSYWFG